MGLLDKAYDEYKKYIDIVKFINFIVYKEKSNKDEVITFLLHNNFHEKIHSFELDNCYRAIQNILSQSEKTGNEYDLLTEKYLNKNWDFWSRATYIDYDADLDLPYYRKEDLLKLSFISELNIDFEDEKLDKQVNQASLKDHNYIRALKKETDDRYTFVLNPDKPKDEQIVVKTKPIKLTNNRILIRSFEWLSPHEIVCFELDYDPTLNYDNEIYRKCLLIIQKEIEINKLKVNEKGEVSKQDLKVYFRSKHRIYIGFNEHLPKPEVKDQALMAEIETLKCKLEKANERIDSLQIQNVQANDEIKESVYLLINVMKDILLDVELTGHFFVDKEKETAKNKPNQTMLARYIESKGIRNLAERNVQGIFAESNKYRK